MINLELPEIESYKLSLDNDKYGWPDQYGSSYIAADYCNTKHNKIKLNHHWLHGCNGPWENAHPFMYVKSFPENHFILVARKDQENYLKNHGAKNVRAIGLPIAYLPETKCERIQNSILFMPTHLRPEEKYATIEMIQEYISYILKVKKSFDFAAICLHSHFFEFEEFMSEFRKSGIQLIKGANNQDRNALLRQKMIMEQFSVMSTNGWGSHVAYALAFGCKVSIEGPKIEKNKEETYKAPTKKGRKHLIEIMFSDEFIKQRETFLDKFYVSPENAVSDIELGQWLIGSDNKISPSEMKELFKAQHKDRFQNVLRYLKTKIVGK